MKTITVYVSLGWNTELEVPDDFNPTYEALTQLMEANQSDWDFQDGGLCVTGIDCEVDNQLYGVDIEY